MDKFQKFDNDKVPLSLIDTDAMEELAKVLDFGAKKYARDNWREAFRCSDEEVIKNVYRYLDAAYRHLHAFQDYVDVLATEKDVSIVPHIGVDDDSELPHIAHAMCNIMFLTVWFKQRLRDYEMWESDEYDDDDEYKDSDRKPNFSVGVVENISADTYIHWINLSDGKKAFVQMTDDYGEYLDIVFSREDEDPYTVSMVYDGFTSSCLVSIDETIDEYIFRITCGDGTKSEKRVKRHAK